MVSDILFRNIFKQTQERARIHILHDQPRQQFISYPNKHDVVYKEQDDTLGMIVTVPEDMCEEIEDKIEAHYDRLMEDAE